MARFRGEKGERGEGQEKGVGNKIHNGKKAELGRVKAPVHPGHNTLS